MLYNFNSPAIKNNSSVIYGDRIYTGQYWDEFALPGFFCEDNAEILVLGLGHGACIRPLLHSNPTFKISAIEIDENLATSTKDYFEKYFPSIRFNLTVGDAIELLQHSKRKYDAIWVDIYSKDGYLPETLSENFYRIIARNLRVDGIVCVNAFGLPSYMSSLQNPQLSVHRAVRSVFPYVSSSPYRRNRTIIGSNSKPRVRDEKSFSSIFEKNKSINPHDSLALAATYLKLKGLSSWKSASSQNCVSTFCQIDSLMRSEWHEIVYELNQSLIDIGEQINSRQELRTVLTSQITALHLLKDLVARKHRLSTLIPVFLAGEVNCSDLDARFFLKWFLDHYTFLKLATSEQDFFGIILPQVIAILLSNRGRYVEFYTPIHSIVVRELSL